MTERELKEIRTKISCPQLGDKHYGEWGILTKNQRLTIKRLLDYIKSQEQYIRKLTDNGVMVAVRCKDCKYCELRYPAKPIGEEAIEGYYCGVNRRYLKPTDFCSYGERKESEVDTE